MIAMKRSSFQISELTMKLYIAILIGLLCHGCASTNKNSGGLRAVAIDYFSVYAARRDFDKLMAFYAKDAQLKDIIYGNELNNKAQIHNFLDWNKGD